MDLGLHTEPQASYRIFQSRILDEYEHLVKEFPLTVMDASRPIETQQKILRRPIAPPLVGLRRPAEAPETVTPGGASRRTATAFPATTPGTSRAG